MPESDVLIDALEAALERLKGKPKEPKNLLEAEHKARAVVRASRQEASDKESDDEDESSKDAKGDEAKTP